MPVFFRGGILSALRKRVTDTFVRNNRADLGRGLDGGLWETIRPGLRVENNRAAASNPTDFPISTVDMPSTDVTIDLANISQGAGAALWVQSSDDWWAVTVDQSPRFIPETTATEVGNFSYSLNNASFSFTTTVPFNFTVTGGGNSFSGFFIETNFSLLPARNFGFEDVRVTRNDTFQYTQTGFKQVTNIIYVGSKRVPREVVSTVAWSRTAWGTFSFRTTVTRETTFNFFVLTPIEFLRAFSGTNAVWSYTERGTTTNTVFVPAFSYIDFAPYTYTVVVPARTVTDQRVSLRQSIEGNLNLIESWVVSSVEAIRSLRVRLRGREITTRAYSDPNLVSQIGDQLVYTATGAEITTKFGLTLAPSPIAQGSTAASTIDIRTS